MGPRQPEAGQLSWEEGSVEHGGGNLGKVPKFGLVGSRIEGGRVGGTGGTVDGRGDVQEGLHGGGGVTDGL